MIEYRCKRRWLVLCQIALMLCLASSADAAAPKYNVLFIAVDDLRPQLGCYGHEEMVTPALDKLAREGRRFNHHYVQVPTCGASRCALLTGQYPATPAAYENGAFSALDRTAGAAPVSLPALFRQHGYKTVSIGKITHEPDGRRRDGEPELPYAWDEVGMPHGEWKDAWAAFFGYADGTTRVVGQTPATERADVPDTAYADGLIANAAVAKLDELKDTRFFLAVGFIKPHLPFNAPSRYWDLYDAATIPAPPNPEPPANVDPAISLHGSREMRGNYGGLSRKGPVTPEEASHLRHAYRACVSYVDAQIGRVLAELDRLGLSESTIVVVWGDHGWHLGEHGVWGKHTLHEVALRSPLIVRLPQMHAPGIPAEGLVESVDIFPTLAELCGLPIPDELLGESFSQLLGDPQATGKQAVYGFWRNGRGHSIRTPRYRLTQWTAAEDTSNVVQSELYDHENDPNETVNVAGAHPEVVELLSQRLRRTVPLLNAVGDALPNRASAGSPSAEP